jgi:hypothetical protein
MVMKKVLLVLMISLSSIVANELKVNIGYSKMLTDKSQYLKQPSGSYITLGLEQKLKHKISSFDPYLEAQAKLNSDRQVALAGIGIEKNYNSFFVKASTGVAYMKINHDPIDNYSVKNDTANSIYASLSIGKSVSDTLDVILRYDRYNLDTKVRLGSTNIVQKDRNSLSLLVGHKF